MYRNNLHICRDDKFYQSFVANQQRFAPDIVSTYFIVTHSGASTQNVQQDNVAFLNSKQIISSLKETSGKYDQIIFHSLPTHFRKKFLPVVPEGILVTWLFYGYEYYHRRDVIHDYLGPETKRYYNSIRNPHYFQLVLNRLMDAIRKEPAQYTNELRRVDRFAHWNIVEYRMIKEQHGLDKMKFVPFSIGVSIPELIPDRNKKYLLFAHSGALTNNHLDGINQLDPDLASSFEKIVFPFSYGSHKRYRDLVAGKARQKFGNKVLFLSIYLDRSSYFNVLSRVKLAWMPQLRSSGAGNIRFCLTNEIPVVLHEESSLYEYYKKQGVQVFSIQSDGNQVPQLTSEQRLKNKRFITIQRGLDTLKIQYRLLLSGNLEHEMEPEQR